MTLREIFQHSAEFSKSDWLCLPNEENLSLETEAAMAKIEFDEENDEEVLPAALLAKKFASTIDAQTLEDVVNWADRLAGKRDEKVRLESLRYYLRFDAFLPKIGASDPPSSDVIMLKLDKEFYDILGEEDADKKCRNENCVRGVVKFSVFCRVHHFEMIKKKPCPFTY